MRSRRLLATGVAVLAMACQGSPEDETAASVAGDSALMADLALAKSDTAAFSEAADVAMANPEQGEERVVEEAIPESAPVSNRVPTTRVSGGDVAMRRSPESSLPPRASTPASRPAPPTPSTGPATLPTRDPTPAPERRPSPPVASRPSMTAPAAGPDAGTPCASPALADQRRCLLNHLARSDVRLDGNYQAVIATLKREAGTGPREKEPASVERLRVAQRSWLVYRDTECRRRNRDKEGPLWAPVRAQCLAEFSGQRTEELAAELAKLRGR